MNTIYRIVRNASTGQWCVASELAKGRKKTTAVAGFIVAVGLACAGGSNAVMAQTASGNGGLINCPGSSAGTSMGTSWGYGSSASNNCAAAGSSGFAFALYNNAESNGNVTPGLASTSRVLGTEAGVLMLTGNNGISLLGATTFNANANLSNNKITNLLGDGASTTDALTFGQLSDTAGHFATALGTASNADGTIVAPTYTIQGKTVTGFGNALGALNDQVTTNVTDNAANVADAATNTENLKTLNSQVNDLVSGTGALGLVQQAGGSDAGLTMAASSGGNVVSLSGTDGTRVLSGVGNSTADDSAVTIAQLKALGLTDASGNLLQAVIYDDAGNKASATLAGANGTVIGNLAAGQVGAGSLEAINGGQLYSSQQSFQNQYAQMAGQFANMTSRLDFIDSGNWGGSLNPAMPGSGTGSTQIGSGADASGDNSSAAGNNAEASGYNSTATGNNAVASGDSSTASGANAVASGNGSTASGANAAALGENSTALGANSVAAGTNSVALGEGSIADRDNSVSVGSVGNERQLTNVAAGTAPTDAVNVSQLGQMMDGVQSYTDQRVKQVGKVADAGTAGAMAMANIPQPFAAGTSGVGVGAGTFRGQSAVALGVSAVTPNGRWGLKSSVMTNTQGDAGVGFSATMAW